MRQITWAQAAGIGFLTASIGLLLFLMVWVFAGSILQDTLVAWYDGDSYLAYVVTIGVLVLGQIIGVLVAFFYARDKVHSRSLFIAVVLALLANGAWIIFASYATVAELAPAEFAGADVTTLAGAVLRVVTWFGVFVLGDATRLWILGQVTYAFLLVLILKAIGARAKFQRAPKLDYND